MLHYAAALSKEPLIIQFSGGKDSIVMLDLLMRHHTGKKVVVFMYFVPELDVKNRVIRYYEKKYGIKIDQVPSHRTLTLKTGKKWKMADVENMLREKYDITYIAQGSRKQDSMARRGMLQKLNNGVDYRNYKFYPVAEMSTREIMAYIKLNKLVLPVEYNHGMDRDFWVPDVPKMLWLKNNFPEDYKKVITEFPQLEAMVIRERLHGSQ